MSVLLRKWWCLRTMSNDNVICTSCIACICIISIVIVVIMICLRMSYVCSLMTFWFFKWNVQSTIFVFYRHYLTNVYGISAYITYVVKSSCILCQWGFAPYSHGGDVWNDKEILNLYDKSGIRYQLLMIMYRQTWQSSLSWWRDEAIPAAKYGMSNHVIAT